MPVAAVVRGDGVVVGGGGARGAAGGGSSGRRVGRAVAGRRGGEGGRLRSVGSPLDRPL